MAENMKGQPDERRKMSSAKLALHVLLAGLLSAIILSIFGFVLSSHPVLSAQNLIVQTISSVLYVVVLAPLARYLPYRPLTRVLALFVPLYITGTLTDLLEAYFYTTILTPLTLVAALIVEGIPLLLIACIIAWLVPSAPEAQDIPSIGAVLRQRSLLSWLWRIVLAGVLYVPIYLFFSTLVTPIEHPFYSDPAFVAQLHTRVQPTSVIIILESIRGILFVLAQLPVLAVIRKSRWAIGLYSALIGAAIEGWVPLLGHTSWPVMMRAGNLIELTGDALGRGLVIALLVALPLKDYVREDRTARTQIAVENQPES